MREAKPLERTKVLKDKEPRKKYFLVCEGKKTENIYFDAMINNRSDLKINPIIEIIPIIRSFGEDGWSNPQKLVACLEKKLQEQESRVYSYETIINNIMDYLIENNLVSKMKSSKIIIWENLKKTIKDNNLEMTDTTSSLLEVCDFFDESLNIKKIINNLEDIMNESTILYEKDFDKICIVVDRDKDSFTENQFEEVLKKCRKEGFPFYVTNPCFEFWLLLHYDDLTNLDMEKIKENPKSSNSKRYLECELSKKLKFYKKSSYKAEELVLKVDVAIENVKKYCEDINKLKDNVGSNIGKLIQELRK